jgi:GxxExxY protein
MAENYKSYRIRTNVGQDSPNVINVQLDQTYRMDLVISGNIIVELKAINHIDTPHRRQLWNYLNITHFPYGMIINFSPDGLYSEWYHRDSETGVIDKIKMM